MSIATLALHILPLYTIFVVLMLAWLLPLTISQFKPQMAFHPVEQTRWVVAVNRGGVFVAREVKYAIQ